MPSIPAFCDNCGLLWDGRGGIHIENSFNVTITNSRINCPRCGHMARFLDGTYNATSHTLELVTGPPLTQAIFQELERLSHQLKAGEITPDEMAAKAATLHEGVGSAIGTILTRYPRASVFIIIFLAMLKSCNGTVDLNRLLDQMMHYASQQELEHTDIRNIDRADKDRASDNGRTAKDSPSHESTGKTGRIAKPRPASRRRSDVNRARRAALKSRRTAFPRRTR